MSRWIAFAALCACGPSPAATTPERAPIAKIATTERGPRGGRLILLSERGVRLADLTRSTAEPAIDANPAWSPDGETIAFASSRGRDKLESTSLWVIRAQTGSAPRRLTSGAGFERDPRWSPSGDSLIYAADRDGGLDIYRVRLRAGSDGLPDVDGEPERLTTGPGRKLSPSISPDGTAIVYMVVDADTGKSRIRWRSLASGETRDLSEGPLDVTPAFAPEGNRIAFAAQADGRGDTDLVVLDLDSGERSALPAEPLADLTGPVWSIDGRHMLATAVFRSEENGQAILSSVVAIDLWADKKIWRALHDPAYVESRLGAALAPRALRPSLIDANQPYGLALKAAVKQHLIHIIEDGREQQ